MIESHVMTRRKVAKIGQRQIDLAKKWNADGLLSDAGVGGCSEIKARPPLQGTDPNTYDTLSLSTDSFSIYYNNRRKL